MTISKVAGVVSTVAALLLAVAPAEAQYARASRSSQSGLRTLGLERVWNTQIQFDSTRGRLAGLTQHISATKLQSIYVVTYPGGRIAFSQRDRDAFQRILGVDGAKKKAEQWVADWRFRTKSKEPVEIIEEVVPDVTLVATSQRGIVQCLDGETGRTEWTNKIGSVRHPTTTAGINDLYVAAVNGTTLYLLDRADGHVVWERRTEHPAGGGPGLSDNLIFVPMINGHIEIFFVDDPNTPAAFFQSSGRCLQQPVIFRDSVAWVTDNGNLYVGNSELAGVRFGVKANAPIPAPATFRAGKGKEPALLFYASSDGYVSAVETAKGKIVSRFSTGDTISQSPLVVEDRVFIVTDSGSMFCSDAETGEELWYASGIKSMLSADLKQVYCLDRDNRIVAIESDSGNRVGSASVGTIDYSFLNTQSDRIYVGTTTGTIECYRKSTQRYPLVHSAMDPQSLLPQVKQGDDAPEEKMPEKKKPAAGEDENPFDLGEKPAVDKPVEAMEDENPFGE